MSGRQRFTPRRRRKHKTPAFHLLGKQVEARFFALVAANPHWLPSSVLEVRPATERMDRVGYADAILIMHNDIRLYLDITSSENAANHKSNINKTIVFVMRLDDPAETVLARLKATIIHEYAKVLECQVTPLLARLAAQSRPPMLQAAE